MLSSLLNASPVAPKVTPRPSASPTKQTGNFGKSERLVDEDDDVVIIEVSLLNLLSLLSQPREHTLPSLPFPLTLYFTCSRYGGLQSNVNGGIPCLFQESHLLLHASCGRRYPQTDKPTQPNVDSFNPTFHKYHTRYITTLNHCPSNESTFTSTP